MLRKEADMLVSSEVVNDFRLGRYPNYDRGCLARHLLLDPGTWRWGRLGSMFDYTGSAKRARPASNLRRSP